MYARKKQLHFPNETFMKGERKNHENPNRNRNEAPWLGLSNTKHTHSSVVAIQNQGDLQVGILVQYSIGGSQGNISSMDNMWKDVGYVRLFSEFWHWVDSGGKDFT